MSENIDVFSFQSIWQRPQRVTATACPHSVNINNLRTPFKNMTSMTEPNQLLVRSKNEDNTSSQSTPNHLTEKKKAVHTMIMFLG